MKRFKDPKFLEGFLIFFVIQPVLFFSVIAVFICAIIESIWG
jgi:hypothetical protein